MVVFFFKQPMPQAAYPCKQLDEPPLAAKLALSQWMHSVSKNEFEGQQPEQFWKRMADWMHKTPEWLSNVFEELHELIGKSIWAHPQHKDQTHQQFVEEDNNISLKSGYGPAPLWQRMRKELQQQKQLAEQKQQNLGSPVADSQS